jgi:hypothetical protein
MSKRHSENELLIKYFNSMGDTIFTEVSLGSKEVWGSRSKNRRLDGVRIINNEKQILKFAGNISVFEKYLKQSYQIEIIEIKIKLDRLVIGQIIVGEYMFKKRFDFQNNISKVIICEEGDEALECFCKENNIKVVLYKNSSSSA